MMSRFVQTAARRLQATAASASVAGQRDFSSKSGKFGFRPRRKPSKTYRPLDPKPKKAKGGPHRNTVAASRPSPMASAHNINITDMDPSVDDDELDRSFGDSVANALRMVRKENRDGPVDLETQLRMMDYLTSAPGSTEDLVGERRALMLDLLDHEDPDKVLREINEFVDKDRMNNIIYRDPNKRLHSGKFHEDDESENAIPANRLAHGDWGEVVIRTDRVKKMWRGGRIESFRALVVGGNLNGCGGYGIGKAFEPEDAVESACRMARRNIFFVDRYRNRTLTGDLMGRQNSCKLHLRTTKDGLRGNPLACEILKLMGITDVVAKAHGNRNHYNVVRATFKALLTHDSLEDIAMKRGVRLINLQKARRLEI